MSQIQLKTSVEDLNVTKTNKTHTVAKRNCTNAVKWLNRSGVMTTIIYPTGLSLEHFFFGNIMHTLKYKGKTTT